MRRKQSGLCEVLHAFFLTLWINVFLCLSVWQVNPANLVNTVVLCLTQIWILFLQIFVNESSWIWIQVVEVLGCKRKNPKCLTLWLCRTLVKILSIKHYVFKLFQDVKLTNKTGICMAFWRNFKWWCIYMWCIIRLCILWLLILKWSPIPKNWSNLKKKKSHHLCPKALKLRQEMLRGVQWLCGVCASAWDNAGGLLHPLCTSTGIGYLRLSFCAVALITVSSLGDVNEVGNNVFVW